MTKSKKIGVITFHASYNHGSCLQAYALQRFTETLAGDKYNYDIINLRTDEQKEIYRTPFEQRGIKNLIKRILYAGNKKKFQTRKRNYERFINDKLNVTKEYGSFEALKKANLKYDYLISGSDQIWNLSCFDFDWSNYLEFCDSGVKISYAASFGPLRRKWNKDDEDRIRNDLKAYDYISVREEGSALAVESLIGKKPTICIDPTLLLGEKEWGEIIGDRLLKQDYIFLYDIKNLKEASAIAKRVSKQFGMPVVIVRENLEKHFHLGFIKKYEAGPIEFLNYVKNAKIVLSSSFHGTVFSIIFKKPFFAINGKNDLRINDLLTRMGLNDRSIDMDDAGEKIPHAFDVSFGGVDAVIADEKAKAKAFLSKALSCKEKK